MPASRSPGKFFGPRQFPTPVLLQFNAGGANANSANTLETVTSSGAGAVAIAGATYAVIIFIADTLSASGSVSVADTLTVTLAPLTLVAGDPKVTRKFLHQLRIKKYFRGI